MRVYHIAYIDSVVSGYRHRVVAIANNTICSHYIWKETPTLTQSELDEAIHQIKLQLDIW